MSTGDTTAPAALAALRVLVVDDEADIRLGLRRLLGTLGIAAREAGSGGDALTRLAEQPADLVITDLMMPGLTGVELLEHVKRERPETVVAVLTGFGTVQTAVQCLQAGAAHFLAKPFDNDEILGLVRRLGGQILARQRAAARGRGASGAGGADSTSGGTNDAGSAAIVAEDERMRRVLELVARVAPSPVSVLVEGESGTGKELVARALHERSAVAGRPFQAVNCAALPDTLLESELFGHKRGSFTGADRDRRGLFVEAEGGTVFLDEVASMSPAFQGKLLRVLQEKLVRPVGGSRDLPVEFRLVAATNRDLQAMVRDGTFREDLYYRLAVVRVHIPPLRERPGDILPLAQHLLALAAEACLGAGAPAPVFSPQAVAALQRHAWPGNVRELDNAVQRAVITCCSGTIQPFHLGLDDRRWDERTAAGASAGTAQSGDSAAPPGGGAGAAEGYADAKRVALESFQREFVQRALERTGGNVSRAAEACGLTRVALQKILKQLGIDRGEFS